VPDTTVRLRRIAELEEARKALAGQDAYVRALATQKGSACLLWVPALQSALSVAAVQLTQASSAALAPCVQLDRLDSQACICRSKDIRIRCIG